MNNIEKLAIEHGSTCYTGQQYHFDKWQLEAFAKALQSSEPVAELLDKLNIIYQDIYRHKDVAIVANSLHSLLAGTSYTHPPASVPLEKYNKLLEAINNCLNWANGRQAEWGSRAMMHEALTEYTVHEFYAMIKAQLDQDEQAKFEESWPTLGTQP